MSDVQPEYHKYNTTLHFDFANKNTTVKLTEDKCDWEVYYIPKLPKSTSCEAFRTIPEKYRQTTMYKLFKQSKPMFDDLIHHVHDHYDWVDDDCADLGWWGNSLYATLEQHGEFVS